MFLEVAEHAEDDGEIALDLLQLRGAVAFLFAVAVEAVGLTRALQLVDAQRLVVFFGDIKALVLLVVFKENVVVEGGEGAVALVGGVVLDVHPEEPFQIVRHAVVHRVAVDGAADDGIAVGVLNAVDDVVHPAYGAVADIHVVAENADVRGVLLQQIIEGVAAPDAADVVGVLHVLFVNLAGHQRRQGDHRACAGSRRVIVLRKAGELLLQLGMMLFVVFEKAVVHRADDEYKGVFFICELIDPGLGHLVAQLVEGVLILVDVDGKAADLQQKNDRRRDHQRVTP